MTLLEKLDIPATQPLAADELASMDAWWRAANYLSVGQVYLLANPLLREKLTLAHVKRACSAISARCPG